MYAATCDCGMMARLVGLVPDHPGACDLPDVVGFPRPVSFPITHIELVSPLDSRFLLSPTPHTTYPSAFLVFFFFFFLLFWHYTHVTTLARAGLSSASHRGVRAKELGRPNNSICPQTHGFVSTKPKRHDPSSLLLAS
jgi:hypothetical protein